MHNEQGEVEEGGMQRKKSGFKLVGFRSFVRVNPRSDKFKVHRFHHVEFWTSDATNVSRRFSWGLGMPVVAKSDLSTGNSSHASYLLRSGHLQFLFTAPYSPLIYHLATPPTTTSTATTTTTTSTRTSATTAAGNTTSTNWSSSPIPSFSISTANRFIASHGLAVRAVAIEVEDAAEAFEVSVANGARAAATPSRIGGGVGWMAEVSLYGDVVLRYVSFDNGNGGNSFLPGFEEANSGSAGECGGDERGLCLDYGLRRLDHAVGNVESLGEAVEYVKGFTGFHEFAEFTAEDVGTAESGLNSAVLANNNEMVLLPMNEPVFGTKRKSQIQTFLEHNEGPGLQHLALVSEDIFKTLREMRKRSFLGGFEFMPSPPPTYYRNLKNRAGDVLTDAQIEECEELGILVDRDDQGMLLQIFTKPVGDRPTLFLEIIQRIGCMMNDDQGKTYQKGGCGGFGKGNFSELFKSIEEYEKTLDAKIRADATTA